MSANVYCFWIGKASGFDSAPVLISLFRWYVNIFKRVISLMSCHKSKVQGIEQTTNDFIVFCNLHKSERRANKPWMLIVKSFARFSTPELCFSCTMRSLSPKFSFVKFFRRSPQRPEMPTEHVLRTEWKQKCCVFRAQSCCGVQSVKMRRSTGNGKLQKQAQK